MAIPPSLDPSIQYLSTAEAYDRWAAVYDTDGNFLQALDTLEMKKLLPCLLTLLETSNLPQPWKLVDLGCGTGRNTAALLQVERAAVVGLDVSPGMLQVARNRLVAESGLDENVTLEVFDLLGQPGPPESAKAADAVVSTLVLEHIPTDIFFQHVAEILKPGGLLLLTNMHSEMGKLSQAGFTDPQTGKKIRPTSYAHTLAEVEETATKHGFEIVRPFEERAVDVSMVPILGDRSRKWVGVTVWFGGILQKRH
ncbi:putative methyltransferase AN0656 [Exophiala dermatitidis]